MAAAVLAAVATSAITSGTAYLIPTWHADGMSMTVAATLAAAPGVGLLLTIIGWGVALDRFGERPVLLTSLTLSTVCATAVVVAAAADVSVWILGALLVLAGAACGAGNGASGRLVVAAFPPERRGTAMGIRQTAQPLAVGVCALTMPVLAHTEGPSTALTVPVVITVLALAVCAVIVPRATRSATARDAVVGNPYRTGRFLQRVHLVSALLVVPQTMLWTFVPAWLIVGHGWGPAAAGGLVVTAQWLGAAGRIAAGRWSDAVGSRMRPVQIIAVAATAVMLALAAADALGWTVVAIVVMIAASVVTVSDNGLAFTAIAEHAGPSWSGRALSIQNTGQFLTTAAVTPVFGAIIGAAGFPLAFAAAGCVAAAAIGLVPDAGARTPRTRRPPDGQTIDTPLRPAANEPDRG